MDDSLLNLNEWFALLSPSEQINLYEVWNHSASLKEYMYNPDEETKASILKTVPAPITNEEIEAIELAFSKVKGIEE